VIAPGDAEVGLAPGGAAAGRLAALCPESRPRRGIVAASHAPRDRTTRRGLACADSVGILSALLLAQAFVGSRPGGAQLLWGAATLPGWLALFYAYGLYERDGKRISHSTLEDVPWLFHALVVGSLLLWLYYHLTIRGGIPFRDLLAFSCFTLASVCLYRSLARRLLLAVLGPERVLLVGDAPAVTLLANRICAHPERGVRPIGRVASSGLGGPLGLVGGLEDLDLSQLSARHRVERIVIAHGELSEPALLELLRRCKELSMKVSVLPQLCDVMGPSTEIDDIEGVTLLGINPPVLASSSRLAKRCMDVAGAAVLLLATAPAMLMLAVAIKLDSPGPVLFRQTRVGRAGARFQLLKFRTMVSGAEEMTERLRSQSVDPHWLHLQQDPRITRLGGLLRRSSLDELPQAWNVLRGQMSLVGPRPIVESEDSQLIGWARSRIDLTPGLTGLWQVLGRTSIPFEEMVKLDYIYVTNWSLWSDVRLIMRTLPVVLGRHGAN
jgi:exopolysaccharide biosynthesis polyprenyl glycosylphosphotransferase